MVPGEGSVYYLSHSGETFFFYSGVRFWRQRSPWCGARLSSFFFWLATYCTTSVYLEETVLVLERCGIVDRQSADSTVGTVW